MYMKKYKTYLEAEKDLIELVLKKPDYVTANTFEIINTGFILTDPHNNRNDHSNYMYADEFFNWMMSGDKVLSDGLMTINPWIKRFVDTTGLPENYSASYGWKIYDELLPVLHELRTKQESRRGYLTILHPQDYVILQANTTHEFPCTIGLHLMIRDEALHMIVNMRSNNIYHVMPYDVYNFTMLQVELAETLKIRVGLYHHQINNAHLYKGDARRLREAKLKPDLK